MDHQRFPFHLRQRFQARSNNRLVGYARVALAPGESRRVAFSLHADRTAFTGVDLTRVVDEARTVRRILRAYPTHYPAHITEQAAIAGALLQGRIDADAQGAAEAVAKRLDLIAEEYERGWAGRPTQDAGIRLTRQVRGVEESRTLDGPMLRSAESRRLGALTQSLHEIYGQTAHLIRKDRDTPIHGPLGLLQAIFLEGEKGLSLQRYKGLGEMTYQELWETTMDPEHRILKQVHIEDAAAADETFSMLMGDEVEPRRLFIQRNAKNVRWIDA